MRAYQSIIDLPFTRILRGSLGCLLLHALPGLAKEVRQRPFSRDWGSAGRLIRNGFLFRAVATKDHGLFEQFLADYWESPVSREFFDHFGHRFETVFLAHHRGIVDEIGKALDQHGVQAARVVEVGVGDAKVLEYLGENLPQATEWHGIDLNEAMVAENRRRFEGRDAYHFHVADVTEWISQQPAAGTVLFTNGGVFEYFRRERLLDLFASLKAGGRPALVAITETIAVNHDLTEDPESYPYGHELSFSHNHPAILREAGFEVLFTRDRFTKEGEEHHPARWLQVVAVAS